MGGGAGMGCIAGARNLAMLAVGTADLPPFAALLALPLVPATVKQAVQTLPANIQTIGYALDQPANAEWLRVLTPTVREAVRASGTNAPFRPALGRL